MSDKDIRAIKAQAKKLGMKSYEGLVLDKTGKVIPNKDALLADLERAEANGG